jgi:DNA-binding beta-propeller fold protein YncE
VIVANDSQNTVAVIDMAGCRVVQRSAVVPQLIGIAVDAADGRLAIESSNMPAAPQGEQPGMSTSTTVTIMPLPR